MPQGITTHWKVEQLAVLKDNGFVESVKYSVTCNEWITIQPDPAIYGGHVANPDKSLDANHTLHSNPYTAPVAVGSTDEIYKSQTHTGKVEFTYATPEIAYEDLTETTVIGWVKTGLGTTEISRIESSLRPDITQYGVDPVRVAKSGSDLPWG